MANEKSGIYKIININSNNIYVGSTNNFRHRFSSHKCLLRKNKHPNKHLQSAWSKYGEESFQFEVIEGCEQNKLIEREQHYIDNLKPHYNKLSIAGSSFGHKMPRDSILKRSKYNLDIVNNIRKDYKNGMTVSQLSEKYDISKRYIRSIAENKRWVDENYDPNLTKKQFSDRLVGKSKNKGERNSQAKLSPKNVIEIRELYQSGRISQSDLASMFGVDQPAVWKIINYRTWKHVK